MTIVEQVLDELRTGNMPVKSAASIFETLKYRMTPEQVTEMRVAIAQAELKPEPAPPPKQDFHSFVPPGWFREYMEIRHVNEAPDSFHFFSALALLTHLIGRKCWYNIGVALPIYPPTSTFLVSPAGQTRRSTAGQVAVNIATKVGGKVLAGSFSPEGLIYALEEDSKLLVWLSEAGTVLNRQDYMGALPQTLCDLMDCPPSYERKLAKRVVTILNPTLSILMSCAPEWILSTFPKSAVGGGLLSRLLCVYEESKGRSIPRPNKITNSFLVGQQLEGLAQSITKVVGDAPEGEMDYSEKAGVLYDAFYRANEKETKHADERMAPYYGRKHVHVTKIAMALTIARGEKSLVIDEGALESALAIVGFIEKGMKSIYGVAGLERTEATQCKIMKVLEKLGGTASRSTLLHRTHLTSKDFDEQLKTLREQGSVNIDMRLGKGEQTIVPFYSLNEENGNGA